MKGDTSSDDSTTPCSVHEVDSTLDIVIVYTQTDEAEANEFKEHLECNILDHKKKDIQIRINMADDTQIESLHKYFEHCRYAFLYLTKLFCEEFWARVSTEQCVINSLCERDSHNFSTVGALRKLHLVRVARTELWVENGNSHCALVPIFTARRKTLDSKIPLDLNSVKEFQ